MAPTWFEESGGERYIEGPRLFENEPKYDKFSYPALSQAMLDNVSLRDSFLRRFHHICGENDIGVRSTDFDTYRQMLKDELKGKVDTATFNSLKDNFSNIQKNVVVDKTQSIVFLPEISESDRERFIQISDEKPMNIIFQESVETSLSLKKILTPLLEYNVLDKASFSFIYCKNCSQAIAVYDDSKNCPMCENECEENYEAYYLEEEIYNEWKEGGDTFIEAMAYHSVKDNFDNVGANLGVYKKPTHNLEETEVDVFIKDIDCVLMCTTDTYLTSERDQAKIFDEMGLTNIILTTDSNVHRVCEKKSDIQITNVDEQEDLREKINEAVESCK